MDSKSRGNSLTDWAWTMTLISREKRPLLQKLFALQTQIHTHTQLRIHTPNWTRSPASHLPSLCHDSSPAIERQQQQRGVMEKKGAPLKIEALHTKIEVINVRKRFYLTPQKWRRNSLIGKPRDAHISVIDSRSVCWWWDGVVCAGSGKWKWLQRSYTVSEILNCDYYSLGCVYNNSESALKGR